MTWTRRTLALALVVVATVGSMAVPGVSEEVEHAALTAGADLTAILPAFTQTFTGAKQLGPLAPATPLTVGVALELPNPQLMNEYVSALYEPGSPVYGQRLTSSQFTDLFSPSAANYSAVVSYYAGMGLQPLTSPDRLSVGFQGTAGQVSTAFHTSFDRYQMTDGSVVYGPTTATYVPSFLPIEAVTGMTNAVGPTPSTVSPSTLAELTEAALGSRSPSTTGTWTCTSGTQGCNEPKFYNETGLFSDGDTGTGTNIGIVDAYDSAETQSDLSTAEKDFAKQSGITAPKENFWYPIPTTANLNSTTSSGWGGEEELDETVAFMDAPGATIDMTLASDSSFAVYEAVDFLVAHNLTNVITMSWGEQNQGTSYAAPENPCMPYYSCNASWDGSYFFLHPVFAEAVAEGITPFSAAGDCGAYDSTAILTTDYPSSDPFVVSVGGTQLNGSGWDTASGAYTGETGWNGTGYECTENEGGGGGGYAPWAQPWWQSGPGQLTKGLRGVPDVSADSSDGTSQASPMWAGWVAVADQMHGGDLGLITPELYTILRNSTAYAKDFHNIKVGNNYYSAGAGWSPVTGIGTPNAGNLLPTLAVYHPDNRQLMHQSLNVSLSATSTSGSSPLTVSFTASASGGTAPYWYDFVPGLYMGQESNAPSLKYQYSTAGAYYASVVVWDSAGNSSVSNPILVNVGNTALTAGLTASATHVTEGQAVTFTGSASGGTSPYQFTYYFGDGTYAYNKSTSATHAYLALGTYCAYAFVTDAATTQDGGMAGPECVNVTAPSAAGAPTISTFTASPATIPLGGTTYFNVSASGSGTLSYVYNNLPSGCTSSNASSLACAPTAAKTYSGITVTVSNSAGSTTSSSVSLTVKGSSGTVPTISTWTASPSTIPLGGTSYLNVSASGSGTLSYAYNNLPKGCLSSNVSHLSCSPSAAGTYTGITVTVSNAYGGVNSSGISLTVSTTPPVNPSISSFTAEPTTIPLGGTTYLNVSATGGTQPYSYVYSGLPAGCTSQNASSLPCAPTAASTYSVTVTVSDPSGGSVTGSPARFSVTTPGGPSISEFTVAPGTIPLGGSAYLNASASGGTTPYTYSYASLPSGCSSSNASKIVCTPSAAGDYAGISVTITTPTHQSTTSQGLTLYVTSPSTAPAITSFAASPTEVPQGGTTYLNATASGGTQPYSWSYAGLPTGCGSSNTSTLLCSTSELGTFSVTVTVSDPLGLSSSRTASFTVFAGPLVSDFVASPPTITLNATTTLEVTVSGGTQPYSYAYSNLPQGCTSQNASSLSCTPTSEGNFTKITVVVTDAEGHTAKASTWVDVKAAPSCNTCGTGGGITSSLWLWVLLGVIAAVVIVALIVLTRKPESPPPPSPPPGYADPNALPPWQQPGQAPGNPGWGGPQ